MNKAEFNYIFEQIINEVTEDNERVRAASQEFIDSTVGLKSSGYAKRIWMQAVSNHVAIQCRDLSLKDKTEMLDDFRKLLFAK